MPDETLRDLAIKADHAVRGLERLLERHRKQARFNFILTLCVAIPLGMLIATGVTIATVSTCFLGGDSYHPAACSGLPGYDKTQERQRQFDGQFQYLFETTTRNEERLAQLEERLRER